MTPNEIAHLRLQVQHITHPEGTSPSAVLAHLGAMQAQDYAGALWSLGLRLPNLTRADIEQAIRDRTIVRTWPMRGTLHFVPTADVRWMLKLLTHVCLQLPQVGTDNWNWMQRSLRGAVSSSLTL